MEGCRKITLNFEVLAGLPTATLSREEVLEKSLMTKFRTWNANHLTDAKLHVVAEHCVRYDTHRDRCVGSSRNKVVVWQKAQNQRVCVFWRIEAASSARLGGVGFLISLPFAGSVQQLPSDFVGQVWIKLTTKAGGSSFCVLRLHAPSVR